MHQSFFPAYINADPWEGGKQSIDKMVTSQIDLEEKCF